MYNANFKKGERYYLRAILLHVRGAKSFVDLCRIDGESCSALREACGKRGLLSDDEHWKRTLRESSRSGFVLLFEIFAVILGTCSSPDPATL